MILQMNINLHLFQKKTLLKAADALKLKTNTLQPPQGQQQLQQQFIQVYVSSHERSLLDRINQLTSY